MKEIWKPIVGFNRYEVSNLGRVKSLFWQNSSKRRDPPKILRPWTTRSGHFLVSLSKNRKRQDRYVHRLVLEAFVGPQPKGMETRHFPDRSTANNHLSNLCWGTRKENIADQVVHGTFCRGEKTWSNKLSRKEVLKIRSLLKGGKLLHREIAKQFGVNKSHISRIATRRKWAWL